MSPNSLSLPSVVGSTQLDVNWRALVSNKTAKPGWYRAYCRSHPVWNWPVWLSVYICLTEPDIYKGLLWNQKVRKHLQPWQGSEDKHITAPACRLQRMQTRRILHLHLLLLSYQAPLPVCFKKTMDQSYWEAVCVHQQGDKEREVDSEVQGPASREPINLGRDSFPLAWRVCGPLATSLPPTLQPLSACHLIL